jgi:hypothetical protein
MRRVLTRKAKRSKQTTLLRKDGIDRRLLVFLPSLVDAVVSVDSFVQAHSGTAVGDTWTETSLCRKTGGGIIFPFKHPFPNLFESAARIGWFVLKGEIWGFGK